MVRSCDIYQAVLERVPVKARSLALLLLLCSCVQPGQSQYGYQDVGHATVVVYGVISDYREVAITGQNTGAGATAGAAAGAIAGSAIGQGRGSLLGIVGGAVIAGIAGHMAEQALQDRRGIEYTIDLDSGTTITIVQNVKKEDKPLQAGERCMVQTTGSYQRVLPSHKPLPQHETLKHKTPRGTQSEDDEDDSE